MTLRGQIDAKCKMYAPSPSPSPSAFATYWNWSLIEARVCIVVTFRLGDISIKLFVARSFEVEEEERGRAKEGSEGRFRKRQINREFNPTIFLLRPISRAQQIRWNLWGWARGRWKKKRGGTERFSFSIRSYIIWMKTIRRNEIRACREACFLLLVVARCPSRIMNHTTWSGTWLALSWTRLDENAWL